MIVSHDEREERPAMKKMLLETTIRTKGQTAGSTVIDQTPKGRDIARRTSQI